RLLYVALSRAKGRVYLVWGRFNDAGTSAPAYLLYPPPASEVDEDVVGALEERFRGLKEGAILQGLEEIAGKAKGAISISDLPARPGETHAAVPQEETTLSCRTFSGSIDRQWKISSYSSLLSSYHHGEEAADRDATGRPEDEEGLEEVVPKEAPSGIFSFPKGIKTGTFLHDLFEHLDFAEKDAVSVRNLVAEKLVEYGFELKWEETILDMVAKVLSLPLEPGRVDLRLSAIRKEERLSELEFTFPLKRTAPEVLSGLFSRHRRHGPIERVPERIGALTFAPVRGFMKGFVDMVFRFHDRFYLVDWTSNFLGPRVEDYGPKGLAAAMDAGFYTLQYHLYAVALNQYLKLRLGGYRYEKHFGGVYYIFLRGVDPEKGPEFGVFRDRPPKALIDELSSGLIGIS
ncbi:MAG: hypothetical protein MUO52_01325, partial [Desulfobacterales bacterium]|nr:hypothetical protein [Desulfobacterales bacterium]